MKSLHRQANPESHRRSESVEFRYPESILAFWIGTGTTMRISRSPSRGTRHKSTAAGVPTSEPAKCPGCMAEEPGQAGPGITARPVLSIMPRSTTNTIGCNPNRCRKSCASSGSVVACLHFPPNA